MDPDPASSGDAALSSALALLLQAPDLAGPVAFGLAAIALLLLASALCAGSEVALLTLASDGHGRTALASDRAAARVLDLLREPQYVLTALLLINVGAYLGGALAAGWLVTHLAAAFGWGPPWLAVGAAMVILTGLFVASEVASKLLALRDAPAFCRSVSGVVWGLYRMAAPLARWLHAFGERVAGPPPPDVVPPDELKAMAELGEARGMIEAADRDLIHALAEFSEMAAREVMVSRMDVVALPLTATLPEALDTIRASGHSRLPLYDEHLDRIVGVVYAKDLLPYLAAPAHADPDWRRLARPAMFVPESKPLAELLRDFQERKTHLALVVDEYGGTAGLVSMEDLLEEIVGDIRDEHDEEEDALFERVGMDAVRFDARIDLDEVNAVLGTDLDTEAYDFETLGGLVYHLAGDIPAPGDVLQLGPLRLRVEDVENHRIRHVLVRHARAHAQA